MVEAHLSAAYARAHDTRKPPATRRTVRRERTIPVTFDGRTHNATVQYDAPAAPLDWDRIMRRVVINGAGLVGAISLAWTTVSIGGLLSLTAPAPVAYAAAAVFDVVWIVCLAAVYVARYDRDRAQLADAAGWFALAVSVAAVGIHGWIIAGSVWVAAVGAVVAGLAKGLAAIALAMTGYRLPDELRQWLAAERAGIGARLALAQERARLGEMEQRIGAWSAHADSLTEEPGPAPVRGGPDEPLSGPTVRAAIRHAAEQLPDAPVDAIVDQLADVGINVDERAVRTVLDGAGPGADRSGPAAPPRGADRTGAPAPQSAPRPATPRTGRPTITDTVRDCIERGILDTQLVLAEVRAVHGPDLTEAAINTAGRQLRKYRPSPAVAVTG